MKYLIISAIIALCLSCSLDEMLYYNVKINIEVECREDFKPVSGKIVIIGWTTNKWEDQATPDSEPKFTEKTLSDSNGMAFWTIEERLMDGGFLIVFVMDNDGNQSQAKVYYMDDILKNVEPSGNLNSPTYIPETFKTSVIYSSVSF